MQAGAGDGVSEIRIVHGVVSVGAHVFDLYSLGLEELDQKVLELDPAVVTSDSDRHKNKKNRRSMAPCATSTPAIDLLA